MTTLTIDNQTVTVPEGTMILDAAATIGITIPTLCHRPELTSQSGCMICVVREELSGQLLPACATPAAGGMQISTTAAEVTTLRRAMLELLLSNHSADCEAPCQAACPCHFDIPAMLDQVSSDNDDTALATVLERLALPATLGHICPAPCEKACRRGVIDAPVSICAAKRFAGEHGQWASPAVPPTGKRITIVGAGPAGLSAAFYLRLQGHACHIMEATAQVGDALRSHVQERLPVGAFEKDVARLRALGVTWSLGAPLAPAGVVQALTQCDGLVLTAGAASAPLAAALGIATVQGLVVVDKRTHQTSNPKVFAGGAAIQICRLAVMACAQGRAIAGQLGSWVMSGHVLSKPQERFYSRAGKLPREMLAGLLADVEDGARFLPPAGGALPLALAPDKLRYEASRCLRCACLKKDSCHLRELCTQAQAAGRPAGERTMPGRVHAQADVVFEAAKCVLCGICVRTAARMGASCGPAFHGRGFAMQIGPPLGRAWSDVPREVLLACVDACPTGSLARLHEPAPDAVGK